MKKLPEDTIAQIIQEYTAGTAPKVIGEKFGIRSNSVTRLLRKRGIIRDQLKRVDKKTARGIVHQYLSGKSSPEIAAELGISSSTICRILQRNKLQGLAAPKELSEKSGKISKKLIKGSDFNNYGTTYFLRWNDLPLTTENLAKMTAEEKALAAPVARDFFREHGFPHPILSPDELIRAFSHFRETDVNSVFIAEKNAIRIDNQAGSSLIKHFSPHFFEVKSGKRKSRPSMLEVFNNDELLLKVIQNRMLQNYHINGNMLRQGLATSKVAYKASIFNAVVAKFIYSRFTKENDIIFDYSMGFGQRQLAALSLPHKVKYVGVDVWDKSVASNQALFDFLSANIPNFNKEAELSRIGSEYFCPEELHGKVALAFSSPPYWNLERYSEDPGQACNESYVDFINGYWKETVANIEKMLSPEGLFIININSNVDGFSIGEDMCAIIREQGFQLQETFQIQLTKNLKFANKLGVHKYEPIYVFRRG